ncbi:MAG: response regulator, partial [Bacteroidota bacterium]
FESEAGVGSRFTLDLVVPVLAGQAVPRSPERRRINRRVEGRPRVLVVDDKLVNRSLLAGVLAPLGFEVVEAENGLDALQQAEAARPDVVLMDLVMPVLDGFEATRRLRAMPGLEAVPIVALSASAFSTTERKSLALGCDAFLPKPVEIDALLDTLDHLLDLTWADDPDPATDSSLEDAESDPAPVAPPTPEDATVLYDLALRGDIQRLKDALNEADQQERHGAAFRAQLRTLAVRFRMQEIRATIEPYLNRDHD